MITILRYELKEAINDLELPVGYEVLHAGVSINNEGHETVSIWCKVDVDTNYKTTMTEHVRFLVFGTGVNMDNTLSFPSRYIDTVQFNNKYAFHIFEVLNKSIV